MEGLVLVAVQAVILESVLVLVGLVAANDRALEGLVLAALHDVQMPGGVVNAHFLVLVEGHRGARHGRVRRDKDLVCGDGLEGLHAANNGGLNGRRRGDVGFLIVP